MSTDADPCALAEVLALAHSSPDLGGILDAAADAWASLIDDQDDDDEDGHGR